MYIEVKTALWERINIPKELEKEFKDKVKRGEMVSPEDAIIFLGDKMESNQVKLIDTSQPLKKENNNGEATFQIFDNNHNLIFSNDN
jgi:hypothetical protein